jgi:hypothetical protein
MSPGNDNQVDWAAAATPQGERMDRKVERARSRMLPGLNLPGKSRVIPQTRSSVMDTLLGKNDLSASDVSGSDPYNATGRQFRR